MKDFSSFKSFLTAKSGRGDQRSSLIPKFITRRAKPRPAEPSPDSIALSDSNRICYALYGK